MVAVKIVLAVIAACLSASAADFRTENSTVLASKGAYHWAQSRAAVIPGDPARVMVTTQEFEKQGSHGYRDIFALETTDGAKTWSVPQRIESLGRKMSPLGVEMVMGDLCPQWHATTRKVLVTGKTFGFRKDAKPSEAKDDRAYERVAYTIYSPAKNEWSGLKIMTMPDKDHAGHPIIEPNAGCNQRFDLPNGEVLLPVRYRADPKLRTYITIVARCTFDGETLTYREHGSELTTAVMRGLYEPSVIGFKGRYFLTMRGEKTGYVARGTDGINYEPVVEWKFDDGKPVGTYCTQQHWITHGDALYLIYTRKGASNDHVFRHRAPIFIAQVDPDNLHVIRATEQILMPETGVDLGGGYAPVDVNENETWVISTEMAFPKNRQGENNRILLAKIIWNQP